MKRNNISQDLIIIIFQMMDDIVQLLFSCCCRIHSQMKIGKKRSLPSSWSTHTHSPVHFFHLHTRPLYIYIYFHLAIIDAIEVEEKPEQKGDLCIYYTIPRTCIVQYKYIVKRLGRTADVRAHLDADDQQQDNFSLFSIDDDIFLFHVDLNELSNLTLPNDISHFI